MGKAISDLVAASDVAEADMFELSQSLVSKRLTKAILRQKLFSDGAYSFPLPIEGDSLAFNGSDWRPGAPSKWRIVPQEAYTESAVASSSTITFAGGGDTAGIQMGATDYFSVGDPVRVIISGTSYYGICTAATDTLLTISGMILPTATAITSLAVGARDMLRFVNMAYAGTQLSDVYTGFGAGNPIPRGLSHLWRGATGYLVAVSAAHTNISSTTEINFKMNAGSNVLTTNLKPAAGGSATTQGAFVSSALGDIIAANAEISDGQTITTTCMVVGGTAESLVVCMTFVVP